MSGRLRLGIFGGTFDPPHVGHLAAASAARHALDLDVVALVVASVPWQKVGSRAISPAEDRLAMVEAAVAGRDDLVACAVEIELGGDSVTADTVAELHRRHDDLDIVVIVGSDAAGGLDTWRRVDELASMARFAVVARPGTEDVDLPPGFDADTIPSPLVDLSSSLLRHRIANGLPVDFLIPEATLAVIADRGLYR